MLKNLNLRTKLIAVICLSSLIVLTASSLLSYNSSSRIVRNVIQSRMAAEVQAIQGQIESLFIRVGQIPVAIAGIDAGIVARDDHAELLMAQTRGVLESDPDILNVYTAYEKGVIDGKDYELLAWMYNADRSQIEAMQLNFPRLTRLRSQ